METSPHSFIDKVVNGLRNTAAELEEFQLQLALGKAEASEKYEEVKKRFSDFLYTSKIKLDEEKGKVFELKIKMEELQVQLALGKAETKDTFNAQKEKIFQIIEELKTILKKTMAGTTFSLKLSGEIEKFKIKMEILRLKFELGKLDARDKFKDKKIDVTKIIDKIKQEFGEKESVIEKSWVNFTHEMNEAYTHLKKAFTK